jgi:SAM-dependent methyltransferase
MLADNVLLRTPPLRGIGGTASAQKNGFGLRRSAGRVRSGTRQIGLERGDDAVAAEPQLPKSRHDRRDRVGRRRGITGVSWSRAMSTRIERPDVRAGYDAWAPSYDATPNPLVALDRRYTMALLAPLLGERILDAGCGTGGHLAALVDAGSRPVGLDGSRGMLALARRRVPAVPLVRADVNGALPLRSQSFDAVLCALVGEHLTDPRCFAREAAGVLAPRGRIVFSVFHPDMAAAGIEAKFDRNGIRYYLGAERHTVGDYDAALAAGGFADIAIHEHRGDEALVAEIPDAGKYLGRPLLLILVAQRRQ